MCGKMLHCPVCSVKIADKGMKKILRNAQKNDMIKKIRQQEG